MKKLNLFLSFIIITSFTYLASCDNNSMNFNQVITPGINNPDIDDCYDDYINNGGTCNNGAWTCFHIIKNGLERTVCDGYLEIKGYTCTNEYFECTIPLRETMACNKDLETGPRTPYGNYIYKVCSNLGGGQTNVTIPYNSNNGPLNIYLIWQCDINVNGNYN